MLVLVAPKIKKKSRNKLLDTFKNIDTIKNATEEQLRQAVPKNIAAAVYRHYHPSQEEDV